MLVLKLIHASKNARGPLVVNSAGLVLPPLRSLGPFLQEVRFLLLKNDMKWKYLFVLKKGEESVETLSCL